MDEGTIKLEKDKCKFLLCWSILLAPLLAFGISEIIDLYNEVPAQTPFPFQETAYLSSSGLQCTEYQNGFLGLYLESYAQRNTTLTDQNLCMNACNQNQDCVAFAYSKDPINIPIACIIYTKCTTPFFSANNPYAVLSINENYLDSFSN